MIWLLLLMFALGCVTGIVLGTAGAVHEAERRSDERVARVMRIVRDEEHLRGSMGRHPSNRDGAA